MIRYRTFRNTDPPLLTELWCSRPPVRALVQPMTVSLFELKVLSKPYFDRRGLIVACQGERLCGFAHAGFGSNADGSAVSTETGATCMLMVGALSGLGNGPSRREVAQELLRRSESYLLEGGAQRLLAGNVYPANPFYLGLYGNNDSPGILESHSVTIELFRSAGYQIVKWQQVLERSLTDFRPPVDRMQMQLRRQYHIEEDLEPPLANWWEACTIGASNRIRHRVLLRGADRVCGWVTYWDMERISTTRGVPHAMGILQFEIDDAFRGQGVGTFLLGESLRRLQGQQAKVGDLTGVRLATVQVDEDNAAALALFKKLGFRHVDRAVVMHKLRGQ